MKNSNAAGIGGGNNGDGENITINGGDVTAEGGNLSAGIGGGNNGDAENITINDGIINARGGNYGAGIGGGEDGDNGNITINGGYIKAFAGTQGAGIGSGNNEHADGTITINGGTVLAISDKGAAIGSGDDGDLEESIYINGGAVYAASGVYITGKTTYNFSWLTTESISHLRQHEFDQYCGAAIGAGAFANQDATIHISGGDIHAFGGDYGGAGIGAGSEQNWEFNDGGEGGDVVITGGTVEVRGGNDASAIGHGWHGSKDGDLSIPSNYAVYDYDNETYAQASKRVELCHKKERHILIAPCEHPIDQRYFTFNDATKDTEHIRHCKYCKHSAVEAHYSAPCDCGITDVMYTVTLIHTNGSREYFPVSPGSEFVLPEGKDYKTGDYVNKFDCWNNVGNGIFEVGDSFTVNESITFHAIFIKHYYVKPANDIEHGFIMTDKTLAMQGNSVMVSVEPEKGYMVDTVTAEFYSLSNGTIEEVTLNSNDDGDYPITMRDGTVTLYATFKRIPHEHDGISFMPCSGSEQLSGSGSWYLLEDTELSINSLEANNTLNICLNGHKLTVTDDNFTVKEDAKLNIYDDSDQGIVTGKTINVYGTFNLYGGNLTGFTTGAVRNYHNFGMYGVRIIGNTSSEHGAGIYYEAKFGAFRIKGSVIIRNNTYTGGEADVEENVYLTDGKAIFVEDKLSENTLIGITSYHPHPLANVVNNLSENGTLENFFSDDDTYHLISKGKGAALSSNYIVTWKNGEDILEVDDAEPGALPSYDGENPSKDGFIFAGWTDGENTYGLNDALPEVTADVTYTAVFNSIAPLGDANCDGKTDVRDVTAIQRHVAEFEFLTGAELLAADVDGNGVVDIRDATLLQMYLAEFEVTLGIQA